MPIVLFRVDERLIHGQVVIGWGHELRPDRYVVVDDELAGSEWEQELYRLGAVEAEVVFVDVEEAHRRLEEWRNDGARTIVLTRDIRTMARLAEGGRLRGERVNLGGVHPGPGRTEVLRYIHLTADERRALEKMTEEGVEITARDVPDAPRVGLASLLKE
jgi:mannose/fructose/N-acetylgalactosamine-specific phosphotransferase system component IIB